MNKLGAINQSIQKTILFVQTFGHIMKINIGDIVVIPSANDHGVIESVEKGYAYIYWNDGVIRSIACTTLIEIIRMKRWTHHAI